MVACHKQIWKPKLKKAWLDYCLINPFGKPDKFMANERFSEKIVLLNKEKVCLSTNTNTNKFLRKFVSMNVISLWKCQKAVSRVIRAILHSNCHSFATKVSEVFLLMKHMIKDSFFQKQLGWIELRNNYTEYAFKDLFAKRIARIFTDMEICRYIQTARRNQNNYNPDDLVNLDNENKDDKNKNMGKKPPEDLNELYGIYN